MTDDLPHHATVHDTLTLGNHAWSVTGVFLGGLNQESVLGLQVVSSQHDATAYGNDLPELFVPEILIRKAIEAGVIQRHPAPQEGSKP